MIFVLFHILRRSEDCLQQAVQALCEGDDIPITLQSHRFFFCFSNLLAALVSLRTLFATLTKYNSFFDALSAAALVSLFVFLVVSSMKHIAFYFHFFRGCDIENGALSLLAHMSIIIRFIFVTPIWFCFLSDSPLTEFPDKYGVLPIAYLLAKIGCLWILCIDFAKDCSSFFRAVFLRAPNGVKCEKCVADVKRKWKAKSNLPNNNNDNNNNNNNNDNNENNNKDLNSLLESCPQADFTTQCGHSFCRKCIERARRADAACPICRFHIPRKWTMPFKFGTLSTVVIVCVF